ncbi:MAG TPA: Crp/Fnr family transcriptional regulator [Dongiaceae bacterium]|jgi:CRP-like cAMP-binding protein|nr:Crp/Fnr family transcriptional regulator [Dongiaceae bacterium]
MPKDLSENANWILSHLSTADARLLQPRLARVDLPLRKPLEASGRPIEHVYFPESGIVSVVANGGDKRSIEVGLIGREGMTGLAVVMGTDRSSHHSYVQCAGSALRMTANHLREAMQESPPLHQRFLLYGHAFLMQTGYTAVANGRSKIEERLARWILMAHDRIDGDALALTHEFLATMLGVRRPGVTVALNLLEGAGVIRAARGIITIVDRKGLEKLSNGAYGVPEAEFKRLFG